MLAMARVLRMGARLLLCDEPTEGLAPVLVAADRRDPAAGQAAGRHGAAGRAEPHFASHRRRPPLPARPGPGRRVARQRRGPRPRAGAARPTSASDDRAPMPDNDSTAALGDRMRSATLALTVGAVGARGASLAACGGGGPGGGGDEQLTDDKIVLGGAQRPVRRLRGAVRQEHVKAVEMAIDDFKAKYGDKASPRTSRWSPPTTRTSRTSPTPRPQELYDRQKARHRSSTCRPRRPRWRWPTWPRRRRSSTSTSPRPPPT